MTSMILRLGCRETDVTETCESVHTRTFGNDVVWKMNLSSTWYVQDMIAIIWITIGWNQWFCCEENGTLWLCKHDQSTKLLW